MIYMIRCLHSIRDFFILKIKKNTLKICLTAQVQDRNSTCKTYKGVDIYDCNQRSMSTVQHMQQTVFSDFISMLFSLC